jgi:hypothetical protein
VDGRASSTQKLLAPPDVLRALQAQADDDDDSDDEDSDEGEAGESEDEDDEHSDQEEVDQDDVRRVCVPICTDTLTLAR